MTELASKASSSTAPTVKPKLEDRGFEALGGPQPNAEDMMQAIGLFGVDAMVIGAGMLIFSDHRDAGRDVLKFGAVVAGALFGTLGLTRVASGKKLF